MNVRRKGEEEIIMMKTMLLLGGVASLLLVGCASDRDEVRYRERYYVTEERPDTVVVDRDDSRVYVREYEVRRDPAHDPHYQNNMEPRVRGKHAESLGWNTENYYRQRGYERW